MVSLNDAKAFPHWKFKDGPITTGTGGNSTSKTTVHSVYWKDLDINQGRFHPIVSDVLHAPWGWDLLEEMELTLLLMTRPFYEDILSRDIMGQSDQHPCFPHYIGPNPQF